jgi:hypothetical protein
VLNMADLHVGKIGWKVGIFMKQMYNTLNKIYVLSASCSISLVKADSLWFLNS